MAVEFFVSTFLRLLIAHFTYVERVYAQKKVPKVYTAFSRRRAVFVIPYPAMPRAFSFVPINYNIFRESLSSLIAYTLLHEGKRSKINV